jgi:hypothetical protein
VEIRLPEEGVCYKQVEKIMMPRVQVRRWVRIIHHKGGFGG